jgi:Arc/MetJ family transcription regulator
MTGRIKRTTIDLDLDAVERARALLGTTTIRETIDKALREVARREALKRAADLIRKGGNNFPTPEQLVEIRKNPHFP